MKAVILSAGKGSRMLPLTEEKPKSMIKVNDIPILIRTINSLIHIGINLRDVIIITGYKEYIIRQYCALMPCTFITQFRQDGTANAINLAKNYIDGNFIVLSGDIIYDEDDLRKLMQLPNSLLYTHQSERLEEYGTMEIAGDKIFHINEKSTKPMSNIPNAMRVPRLPKKGGWK